MEKNIIIPDLGGADSVEVIEIAVSVGDTVALDDGIITLESDKASMDVPAPFAGKITAISVSVGDTVSEGDSIGTMTVEGEEAEEVVEKSAPKADPVTANKTPAMPVGDAAIYASPSVRRIAHELDIDLRKIKGTGNKGRITKEDVKAFLSQGGSGLDVLAAPKVDFSKFGAFDTEPLKKINKATAKNLHRNWVTIPHVTQFDAANITAMEAYRQAHKAKALEEGVRLTPIAFVIKAVVSALKAFPRFNSSLDATGENLIMKKYIHIGVAVDTPNGLVVPVLRDADQKSVKELARELVAFSEKARDKGLSMADMQGGCFTISSLGGIGGTAFTPIINAPEVAILGLSKSSQQPVWDNESKAFEPQLMLPLSLSYDHRVIDGALAARFIVHLSKALNEIDELIL